MSSYFESRFKEMKGSGNQGNTSKNIPSTGEQQNCHDKIVVIGADCPLLDVALVNSAFDQLDEAPVVLGPSLDGGYYLIAMREKCWGIFDNIHWSTANVLSQTIERLERQRIQFKLLQPLNDIDELDDLIELKIQLDAPAIQLDTLDQKLLHHIDQALSNSNQ